MRTAFTMLSAAYVVLVPIAACAENGATTHTAASATRGKPAAPVDVTAVVHADRAEVAVDFRAAATSVDVRVSGTSGLTVTSPASVVSGGSFAKGESTKTLVTFTPPAGQAHLVVTVAGIFDGSRGAKTASFTIGQSTPAQSKKASEGVKVEGSGEKVREFPAERR